MLQSARDDRKTHLLADSDIAAPQERWVKAEYWRPRRGPLRFGASGTAVLRSNPEMLGEFQALRLIVRADALAVHRIRPPQHFLIDQAADDLAMLENERHFARAHFQHRTRAFAAGAGITEAGIEEARIVHAEFTDQRIERHHLGGIIRRHLNGFLGGQNVELAGIENEAAIGPRRNGFPEFVDGITAAAVNIDHAGVALGAVADEAAGLLAREINTERNTVDEVRVIDVDQLFQRMQCVQFISLEDRFASAETNL